MLHVFFTPSEDEAAWARERTETPESLLALLVDLKCFQRMARSCSREEIPHAVTDHVRHCLGLAPETEPDHGADRTMRLHRAQVRKRQGATRDPRRARALAAAAIREAAQVRNHPPDLINVALERIIEASLELPAYSTLDDMATTIRAEVNEAVFAGITGRMCPEGRQRAQGLLDTAGSDGRSMFNRLKKPAQRATWSRFKAQAEYLDEVDALGDTAYWVEGLAPSKVADFAGEAAAQDVDTLSRYGDAKKLALVACLAHTARMQARDDLAEMLCKRVASIVKKAKTELEEIRLRQRAVSERLIGTYRTVLENLDPDGEAAAWEPGQGAASAVAAVEEAGGFAAQLSDIEEVSAYHGDNYEVLVHGFFRKDRAVMFELAAKLDLAATSSDDSVLAALEHARAYHAARRDHIPPAPGRRRRGGRLGPGVRVGELAARGHRPAPPRHGDPEALRGDGVHLPGRGTAHRGHRGRRRRGVRRLARQSPALGGMRAAARGILRRRRPARHRSRVHRAAPPRPPGRRRGAGRRVRGQRRPSDRRGWRAFPQAAPQRGHPGGRRETGGGGRPADAGAVAAVDRGPHRLLARLAPPLRTGGRVRPEDR